LLVPGSGSTSPARTAGAWRQSPDAGDTFALGEQLTSDVDDLHFAL
jgi:hypothetical protein